jgi:AcrR family transcriptional regulator
MAARPMLAPAFVEGHQRARVTTATAELASELGLDGVTVTAICEAAQMGRSTFYLLFDGRAAALEYAFAAAYEQIFGAVDRAGLTPRPWLARLEAGVGTLFAAVAAEPRLAELCLVHSLGAATLSAGSDFEMGVEAVTRLMTGGCPAEGANAGVGLGLVGPGHPMADYLARGIVSLAKLRVLRGEIAELPQDRDDLVLLAARSFPFT